MAYVRVREGEPLPPIAGETQLGPIDLAQFRGRPVVLYFYPKDSTPGCTREAVTFQARMADFERFNAQVVGCSVDSVASHQRFAERQGIQFPLISDRDKSIASTLGVLNERGTSARRTTLVIDGEGIVRAIFEDVKIPGHVDQVLEAVQKLV